MAYISNQMARQGKRIRIRLSGKPRKVFYERGGGLMSMFSRKKRHVDQKSTKDKKPRTKFSVRSIKPKIRLRLSAKPRSAHSNVIKIASPKMKVDNRTRLRSKSGRFPITFRK